MKGNSRVVRVRMTIPFHHCDPLSVVWHGRYLEYFELARTELFASHGIDVLQIRDLGFRMYVADCGPHRIQVYQKDADVLPPEEIAPVPSAPTLSTV